MAQHDYNLSNAGGAIFRGDLNDALSAIATNNSGASAPSTLFPGMVWLDTSTDLVKIRNQSNTGWDTVAKRAPGGGWVAYSQGAPLVPLAGRNLIINGSGRINQRGYTSGTATTSAGQYTLDRWAVVASGQSLTFTGNDARRVMTAPAGGVGQVIEGRNIVSGDYVLNWEGTATATVDGVARTKGETFTLTENTGAKVIFSAGTFADVQFEVGSVVTPFEQIDAGAEFLRCMRYYLSFEFRRRFFAAGTLAFIERNPLPVIMRASPAVTQPLIAEVNVSAFVAAASDRFFASSLTPASTGDTDWSGVLTFDAELAI